MNSAPKISYSTYLTQPSRTKCLIPVFGDYLGDYLRLSEIGGLYIKDNIKNEICTQKLVIAHISHNFLGQKCLIPVCRDYLGDYLGLPEIGGLTQKWPLTFENSYI